MPVLSLILATNEALMAFFFAMATTVAVLDFCLAYEARHILKACYFGFYSVVCPVIFLILIQHSFALAFLSF